MPILFTTTWVCAFNFTQSRSGAMELAAQGARGGVAGLGKAAIPAAEWSEGEGGIQEAAREREEDETAESRVGERSSERGQGGCAAEDQVAKPASLRLEREPLPRENLPWSRLTQRIHQGEAECAYSSDDDGDAGALAAKTIGTTALHCAPSQLRFHASHSRSAVTATEAA